MHAIDPPGPLLRETKGILFHLGVLNNFLVDSTRGVIIASEAIKKNYIIKKIEFEKFTIWFVAVPNEYGGTFNDIYYIEDVLRYHSNIREREQYKSLIHFYADWHSDNKNIENILENTIEAHSRVDFKNRVNPEIIENAARLLLQTGYEQSVHVAHILRRELLQYWILPLDVDNVFMFTGYFSKNRQKWYVVNTSEEFNIKPIAYVDPKLYYRKEVIFKTIREDDLKTLNEIENSPPFSFAEEMIAAALIEIHNNRVRSAVIHSIIALESSSRRALKYLLENRLKGFEKDSILNAMAKELSIVTLAQYSYTYLSNDSEDYNIDWNKINTLYGLRNMIVHRDQKRFSNIDAVEDNIKEVFLYVRRCEYYLRGK